MMRRELAAKRETEASSAKHTSRIAEAREREWTEQISMLEARLAEADASLLEERERRGAIEARCVSNLGIPFGIDGCAASGRVPNLEEKSPRSECRSGIRLSNPNAT